VYASNTFDTALMFIVRLRHAVIDREGLVVISALVNGHQFERHHLGTVDYRYTYMDIHVLCRTSG